MSLRILASTIRKDRWCGLNWRNKSPSSFAGKGYVKMKSRTFLASINPKCPNWLEGVFPDLPAIGFFDTLMRLDAMFTFRSDRYERFKDAGK